MLLYVHVPFCRRKCRYCAFFSRQLEEGAGDVKRYLETAHEELTQWAGRLGRVPVESIFFGGGTPSLLEPAELGDILRHARELFVLADHAEISMEANPDSLHSVEKAAGFLAAGVNRISLGVQSFDDGMLEVLGRLHRAEAAKEAFLAVREAGCTNLSLDLMWGLPGQTPEQWLGDVRMAIGLRPDHISAYGLSLEPGTPMASAFGEADLPSEDALCTMYLDAIRLLREAGLHQYEISNFARNGFECRHNRGYWDGLDYLGIGPSATSTVAGERWTNPETGAWTVQVREGRRCGEREKLDRETRALELMMLRLRMTDGLPLEAYRKMTGRNFFEDHGPVADQLCREGLACRDAASFRLTVRGMLVSNSILSAFFAEESPV